MRRYSRQKELVNQDSLRRATVLVAGVGGLGGFSSVLLAMAGVGRLIIVDRDVVEESNLNRQILYTAEDIGRKKAVIARERLERINPEVEVVAMDGDITEVSSLPDFHIAVDGLDNMESRFLLEEICLERGVPYVFGAVEGYMGMVTFIDSSTRRIRDFMSGKPRNAPQVIGAAASMTASIQVMEVLKYLSGRGDLLRNRLLIYDGLSSNFTEVRL